MSVEFNFDTLLGQALAEWWLNLKDNSSARAELRRCDSVDEVAMTPSFQRFCQRQLRPLMKGKKMWEDRMAAVVGLISHLKHDQQASVLEKSNRPIEVFVEQMAYLVSAERPLVSELRFRRLLQQERSDLYPAMIRITRMLKGNANLYGLAYSVFYWGDVVKKRWAYAYFPKVPSRKSA